MKPPFWKRWLSYLYEIPVESASSEHNPTLRISLARGRYQLCSANAIYSYGDLYDNFTRAFRAVDIAKRPVERVLLLGFGLGSIPYMLEKVFDRKYHYTAVEIDEEVLYLANKYVVSDLDSPMDFICADAYAFVMQCEEQFDLICMDIFLDDVIPEQFEQEQFLSRLGELLTPDGLLMYNRLTVSNKDLQATQIFFQISFKKVFPQGTYIDLLGNWMLVNRRPS